MYRCCCYTYQNYTMDVLSVHPESASSVYSNYIGVKFYLLLLRPNIVFFTSKESHLKVRSIKFLCMVGVYYDCTTQVIKISIKLEGYFQQLFLDTTTSLGLSNMINSRRGEYSAQKGSFEWAYFIDRFTSSLLTWELVAIISYHRPVDL